MENTVNFEHEAIQYKIGNYILDESSKILRIDWFEHKEKKACMRMTVCGMEVHPLTVSFEKIKPIKLKRNYLDKLGFIQTKSILFRDKIYSIYVKDNINVFVIDSNKKEKFKILDTPIRYVHELQNIWNEINQKELKFEHDINYEYKNFLDVLSTVGKYNGKIWKFYIKSTNFLNYRDIYI